MLDEVIVNKIILPLYISRGFISSHREWIFVYGASNDGKGFFGQTYCCHGEPNAFPVPTMFKICNSATNKYFDDNQYDYFVKFIDDKLSNIPLNRGPIIPFRNIGRGHSEMYLKAPKLYEHLMFKLSLIQYPKIVWDYAGRIYPLYTA